MSALRHQGRDADVRDLRAGVLRLGAVVGWDASVVARFAESVTGREWSRCERVDLLRLLAAYAEVARRVRATQARLPGARSVCGGPRTADRGHQSEWGSVAHDEVE